MPLCCHSGGGETSLGITGPGGGEIFMSEALWLGRRCEQRTAWVPADAP
jgi:hypothetical protein